MKCFADQEKDVNNLYLGVDIGTSVTKGALIDDKCHVRAQTATSRPLPASVESCYAHDPESDWWGQFARTTRSLLQSTDTSDDVIRSVGITGMAPNVCLVNKQGESLGKASLFFDRRANVIEHEVENDLGTPPWQNEVLAKLIWLRQSLDHRWSHVHKVLGTHNYIVLRLTGAACIDPVAAAECGCIFDPGTLSWKESILKRYGISAGLMPQVMPAISMAGTVSKLASAECGIPAGTPVVAGTTDTISSLLGCGVHTPGDTMIYYGTYGCAVSLCGNMTDILKGTMKEYPMIWVASIPRLGHMVRAFASLLFPASHPDEALTMLDQSAADAPPGSNGVTFVPSFARSLSRTEEEPEAALLNLFTTTTRSDVCRALLESFGFGMRRTINLSKVNSINGEVFACGGGAKSSLWRQIVSDIAGLSQRYCSDADRALGSSVLAAALFQTDVLDRLKAKIVSQSSLTTPRNREGGQYESAFRAYTSYLDKQDSRRYCGSAADVGLCATAPRNHP